MDRDPFGLIGDILSISLSAAVPLRIIDYKRQGGPTDDDRERARRTGHLIAEKGDVLQFRGKKKGEAAEIFNALADGLAVLAFCPGGVKFLGHHWDATTEAKGPTDAASDAV